MQSENNFWILQTYGDVKSFVSQNALETFIDEEKGHWSWLIRAEPLQISQQIFIDFIVQPLQLLTLEAQRAISSGLTIDKEYITHSSPIGELIKTTRNLHGDVVATLLLFYLHPKRESLTFRDDIFRARLYSMELAYKRELAMHLAFEYMGVSQFVLASSNESVESYVHHLVSAIDLAHAQTQTSKENFVSKADELERDYQERIISQDKRSASRVDKYKVLAKKTREDAALLIESAKKDLASAKAAYHEHVDFDASVSYWDKRREGHFKYKCWWFAGVVFCMLLMLSSVAVYYKIGGVSGMILSAATHKNEEASKSGVESERNAKVSVPDASVVAAGIADFVCVALLVSLLSVLLRISLRQFNNHSHLVLESMERMTMTKTYLALLNEGKLQSEESRKLILEALFRPSQVNGVADTSFSGPIELVVKAITENKGAK